MSGAREAFATPQLPWRIRAIRRWKRTRRAMLWWAMAPALWLFRLMPMGMAVWCGRGAGWAASFLARREFRRAVGHLHLAFGEAESAQWRQRTARRSFANLGQNVAEFLHLDRLSPDSLRAMATFTNGEALAGYLAAGRGVMVVTPHFGNWEVMASRTALEWPVYVVAKPARSERMNEFVNGIRERAGYRVINQANIRGVMRALKEPGVVGTLPDQDIPRLAGVHVEFFGAPAFSPTGPATLALSTGAALVPMFAERQGRRYMIHVEGEIAADESLGRDAQVEAMTAACQARFEAWIRRFPDQWVWNHQRWKTKPAGAIGGNTTNGGA